MVQERSSRSSHPSIPSTKSTKRVFFRFLKPSEQAAIDDELAALEEAIHHSSFALLPAVLTPSRAPSNTLVTSTRALFFEGPVHLDFASGWDKGPVIEWYDRHRRKGSTLIEKLQLRKFLQPPYYHECIVVFTQGGHTYRVDRRPDPDAPFDTIMRAGCKPYDTVQAVESRNLRELENASDCVVELHWHGKPEIDLLFVLSICFALRQDEHTKQYTLQRYNCYFLSWMIIVVAVREIAAWETRLGDVMSEVFLHNERKGIYREARRVRVNPSLDFSLDLSLDLVQALALKPAQVRARVQELEWELVLDLELELKRTLARALALALARRQRVRALEQKLRLELALDRDLDRELKLSRELALAREGAETKPAWLRELGLDHALRLAQELELRSMTLVLEQSAASKRKLLFPAALDAWLSTTLQNMPTRSLDKPSGLSEKNVRQRIEEEAEELVRAAVSKLVVLPAPLSISLTYKGTNSDKAKVSKTRAVTHTELEQHMRKVLANHAQRVARWGLAPAAEVERDMLEGMERVWLFVSQHPVHVS